VLGFAVDLDTDFIGKEAVEGAANGDLDRNVACLTLDDPEEMVLADRPVLARDGDEVLGYVHAAEYGYAVGTCVIYTYLPPEYAEPGTAVDVRYEGERHAATVREEPLL
jgi:aminomethyltransferase